MDVHVHEAHDHGLELMQILSEVPDNSSVLTDKPHDLIFESWSFTSDRPLKKEAFKKMLDHISPDIIRAKGFVYWHDPEYSLVLFNLVGKWINLEVHFEKQYIPRETRLVFIGIPGWKKQSDIEQQLNNCMIQTGTPEN